MANWLSELATTGLGWPQVASKRAKVFARSIALGDIKGVKFWKCEVVRIASRESRMIQSRGKTSLVIGRLFWRVQPGDSKISQLENQAPGIGG